MARKTQGHGADLQATDDQSVSRRSFLMGTALGTTGLVAGAATSALAGDFSASDNSAVTTDSMESTYRGARTVNMKNVEPIPTVPEPDAYDYETDVLLLGFGVGGTSACLTAVNRGANVIAMERSYENTWHEHAGVHIFQVLGEKSWLERNGLPDWSDETIELVMQSLDPTHGVEDESLDDHKTRFTYMKEGLNAFQQIWDLGPAGEMKFVEIFPNWKQAPVMMPMNSNIPGGGNEYYPYFHKYHPVEHEIKRVCEASGQLQVLWGTPATNLIQDPETGRILGARGEDPDGNPVYVKAKVTIDCIGGMGANYDMCQYYGRDIFTEMISCHIGSVTNDGRGMRMAQGAGCGLRTLPRWTTGASEGGIDVMKHGLPWNLAMEDPVVKAAFPDKFVSGCVHIAIQLGRQHVLKVNKYGKRFFDESTDWWPKIWTEFKQPSRRFYTVYDSNIFEDMALVRSQRYGMCERLMEPDTTVYFNDDDIRPFWHWHDQFEWAVEQGMIVKADTLEELAEKLGINVENFLETVERYNSLCDAGVDEDYGKAEDLFPVREPPFYGLENCPAFAWQVCGGVATEGWTGRVMNEKGEYIPGFYCGSNDAGQIDGECFGFNITVGGGSDTALIAGYIAGMHAAEEALGA